MGDYTGLGPIIKLTPAIKRKISSWKPRIYKKYRTIREFIEPLNINKARFSQWIGGHNMPPIKYYDMIEIALKELGV